MAHASNLSVLHRVSIELGDRSYPINIGAGLLGDSASWSGVPRSAQALIVTNTTVAPLYAQQLKSAIAAGHDAVHIVELPDGEEHKTWQSLNLIFDALLQRACD